MDQLIAEPTSVSIGGTDFVLYPAAGGETSDALMVDLPASGVLSTGDVMMPYLSAPFFAEGSPEGLLDALRLIAELSPHVLVHGPHNADRAVHRGCRPRPARRGHRAAGPVAGGYRPLPDPDRTA